MNSNIEGCDSGAVAPASPCGAWGSVCVITAEEIEASTAQHLGDVLKYYCGAHVLEYGMLGQPAATGFRGATGQQVLIMIDGRAVNDPQFGGYDLNFISLDMVERVEVVKGCATLYGRSGALGGIVNITTRRVSSERPYTKLRYEKGNFGLRRSAVHFGKRFWKRCHLTIVFDERGTDGFRVKDDYDGQNILGRIDYEPTSAARVTSTIGRYKGHVGRSGSDSYPAIHWRQEDERIDGDVTLHTGRSGWSLENSLFFSDIRTQGVGDSMYSYESEVYGGQVKASFRVHRNGTIRLGSHIQRIQSESPAQGEHTVHESSLQATAELRPCRRFHLLLSGQCDGHSEYSARVSPGLTCGTEIPGVGLVRLSASTGYRFPALHEIFWDDGEPKIEPEQGTSFDLSLSRRRNHYEVRGSFFANDVSDRILWKEDSERVWMPFNVDTRSTGFELSVQKDLFRHVIFGSTFTYLDAENRGTGRVLARNPETLATAWLQLSRAFIRDQMEWKVRIETEYTGRQYADFEEKVLMKKYALLHARMACRIQDLSLYVTFRNLTDKTYQSRAGYPMPGRTISFGGGWELWD
ncbi:MAG: TonB-dependent receptor [Gemmatimonadota bacterium]|nr:MAG: TonB-dependent receptor [Gemmatimonadota bacterium]